MRRGQEIFSDSVLLSNTVYLKGHYKNSTCAPLEQEKELQEFLQFYEAFCKI